MISIIVPVFNEQTIINKFLESLPYSNDFEVIIADGGSTDGTREICKEFPVKIVGSIKNRAIQMNCGAHASRGDILLFLHADCTLKKATFTLIDSSIENGFIGGCLTQRICSQSIIFRFIEGFGNIRARLFKIFYGDQAIFVKRDYFSKINGFDNVALFEDALLSKKLKKTGKLVMLKENVFVSPRRWMTKGIVKTTLLNWFLTIAFLIGISPNKLYKLYKDVR